MLNRFIKDAVPYGLVTYLLIDGQAPKFNQYKSIEALKQNIAVTQQIPQANEMVDIDAPLPKNLSGFNYKSAQGISNFFEKILDGGPNMNISGGLNYGYNYQPKGPHTRWH